MKHPHVHVLDEGGDGVRRQLGRGPEAHAVASGRRLKIVAHVPRGQVLCQPEDGGPVRAGVVEVAVHRLENDVEAAAGQSR